jgi:hypothetical protein
MPWQMLWPDFLKKRLCRYLLQHYLGHFFKEKISLEQLSIDIYNGTGCVKNLNLDCEALNEQLNAAATAANSSASAVPIEIVSGFVGYISVYIPWHDLFNDYCKLTIKNVQITIRTKQRKQTTNNNNNSGNSFRRKSSSGGRFAAAADLDDSTAGSDEAGNYFDMDDAESDSNSNSMFSSMFVDSLMNTSMHIAQECLNNNKHNNNNNNTNDCDDSVNSDEEFNSMNKSENNNKNSLLGLEAFASTIDSILSRIKINMEQIQIRIENLDNIGTSKLNESNIMSSSAVFSNRPSNGIALELRIKSIKYFDIDSTINQNKTDNTATTTTTQTMNVRNTTKSFNIEGLTIYFDEFIVKDDSEINSENFSLKSEKKTSEEQTNDLSRSLNSTIDLTTSSIEVPSSPSSVSETPQLKPLDESPPFSYDLNPEYYLYTNPIILITFSGIQTIKLTINNMRPTDLIIEATTSSLSSDSKHHNSNQSGANTAGTIDSNDKLQLQQQRPFLELNAQFGSIKCLMSPKQIHLLTAMFTKLTDYMDAANATRKAFKSQHHQRLNKFNMKSSSKQKKSSSSIRGCGDKRKFEALIHNDLILNSNSIDTSNNENEDYEEDEDAYSNHFKTIDNETSVMFYSMMSESSAFNNNNSNTNNINSQNLNLSANSPDSSGYEKESNKENISDTNNGSNQTNSNSSNNNNSEINSEDRQTQTVIKELKQTIEQLQTDVIMANNTHGSKNSNQHNLFQTFKVTFRMFSLTILHHDPLQYTNNTGNEYSSTKRLLVDRMKHLSDLYFDWVSTIDASSNLTSGSSASSIDKNTITKYHQACPFNDHFLFLLKPINLNLVQKINQRHLNTKQRQSSSSSSAASQIIQYSLNEVSLSIGYIQINEYLVATPTKKTSSSNNNNNNNKRFKTAQIIEACQAATITEIIYFNDSNTSSLALEQPCLKVQLVFYEPLDVQNKSKQQQSRPPLFNQNTNNNNIQTNLLNNHFENISISLNQSLNCELDVSLIDRLYYLINNTSNKSASNNKNTQQQKSSNTSKQNQADISKITKNLEIKCSQIIKVALRFPIADLRRAQPPTKNKSQPKTAPATTLNVDSITPVTLIAFRQLREQILTLHLFDFNFQTLLSSSINLSSSFMDSLNLTLTSSQINAYYQYTKKDRPIHFGLIQQRLNEPRSLICSIKLPTVPDSELDFNCQILSNNNNNNNQDCLYNMMAADTNMDSLKHNYNINVGRANRFNMTHTIKEENENLTEKENDEYQEEDEEDAMNKQHKKTHMNECNEDDEEDENEFSPFSRIHSLISSEKNRRIVNAGNKSEMQSFINQSKARSETTITLVVPQLKFLIADQKFLNDIYNCILNDLIMWVPSPVPPIESVMTSLINDAYMSSGGSSYIPGLNYLVDYNNYENDFIATRVCEEDEEEVEGNSNKHSQQQFHMCRSAILKPSLSKSESENSDYCESDDDQSKRKYQQQYDDFANKNKSNQQKQALLKNSKNINNKNTLSFIFCIESAHLKAFILNNNLTQQTLKYGEFDIKTNNFQMCIAISESLKTENINTPQQQQQNNRNSRKQKSKQSTFKIEKQQICIFTDQIDISHSTKTCPNDVTQLKYPTNFSSFESLFKISKTKDLITLNDPAIVKSLFNNQSDSQQPQQQQQNLISVPMVSIGIKSKFNTKKNTKQLLVALNFNNLTLHHIFCAQPDYWIFQLILLFDLIDIDIVGYEVPIVLTELHLNVSNSCVIYKPAYIDTHSLIAFKSLHWSSNVTAESSLTLLVFNIEDIYLFLSKQQQQQQKQQTDESKQSSIDLKKDYICVANSDLFELRLLISDEEMMKKNNGNNTSAERKSPLLDIKIRSNLIQLRTCVDSAFTLIELINYIVSDGDLHKPNLIMSEFMSNVPSATLGNNNNNISSTLNTISSSSQLVEMQQQHQTNEHVNQVLINDAATISTETLNPSNSNLSKAINIASSSIPIQRKSSAIFTVGTPPPTLLPASSSSFKSSSSSSFSQQIFYSPSKNNNSNNNNMSPVISSVESTQLMNQQKTQPISVPLPSPSLSFVNFKNTQASHTMTSAASFNGSSSAESLISDMVKEAMTSNPMTTSIYGSLPPTKDLVIGTRKRNPSLTLLSPDLQTKRLISHSFMLNTNIDATKLNTLKENSNLNSLRNSDDDEDDDDDDDDDDDNLIQLNKNKKTDYFKDLKKESDNENDQDESLIASIHFNHKKSLLNKKPSDNEDESEDSDDNYSENTMNKSNDDQDEDFHFDLPFSNISPMTQKTNDTKKTDTIKSSHYQSVNRQLMFDKNNRRLHFKPNNGSDDDDEAGNYVSKNINRNDEDDNEENEDEDLLRDFDIIDVIPGFGEPPRNNQDFEVKNLRHKSNNSIQTVIIKEDHFKKPLTKIDVLKAPDSYPCPLNVYCIQEISINWCLYGGSDFSANNSETPETNEYQKANANSSNKINRTLSSPVIVATAAAASSSSSVSPSQQAMYLASRSRNSSTSSNSLSMSPQLNYQSPPGQHQQLISNSSTSPSNPSVKFNNKSASVNFSKEKYLPRKAGGRIIHKYDTNSLNWLARGGKSRNLDVCMEIALYKVKTKIDMYSDLNDIDDMTENKENKQQNESPYLYRVALAIGDIEIRDKLASSPFNMFLFRYESDHCPKHTNSNMLFIKFLCSKSMDAQRLIECDIKLSIQPLRFNIDQDALIFLVEFFTKLASKDLNEFSKTLVPPPPPQSSQATSNQINESDLSNIMSNDHLSNEMPTEMPTIPPNQPQTPQQIFIRNFIFSPDLLVRFDFSGKYDSRSDTKMDTLTKLLMVAIQLSNTEIKLKRICYRRGFLGAEKLLTALIKEWLSDIQRNQMKNLIKGWGIFNSLIQFFEGFTYLIWYPIEQYRKDGRVLCGIQKGSAAFSTCTVLATIELTNRMFQATKNIAEFFYDLVTPHRANSHHHHNLNMLCYGSNNGLVDTILTGVGNNRNIRLRRHPNDIREGLTNAYYVMYEGINDTAANLIQEINQGAEHKGIPGAIGGALRQLPSTALAPIVLTTEATCNILSGIRNQLKPDEKRDDDQKWKTIAFNS